MLARMSVEDDPGRVTPDGALPLIATVYPTTPALQRTSTFAGPDGLVVVVHTLCTVADTARFALADLAFAAPLLRYETARAAPTRASIWPIFPDGRSCAIGRSYCCPRHHSITRAGRPINPR